MKSHMKGHRGLRVFVVIVSVLVVVVVSLSVSVLIAAHKAYPPSKADVIIVLGARVYPNGVLSKTLYRRTDKALEAWKDGLSPAIIVCGAQGSDEPITEAQAMANYLTENGVPKDAIYLEDQSTNTYENLIHAKAIMEENGMESALVVTSDYHIARALWLCKDIGIRAKGYPSLGPDTKSAKLKSWVQESLSWTKYGISKLIRGHG